MGVLPGCRIRCVIVAMCAQVHVQGFTVVPSRSGVIRTLSERAVLELFNQRMAAVSLSGYIFFGSSVSISAQVGSSRSERHWFWPSPMAAKHWFWHQRAGSDGLGASNQQGALMPGLSSRFKACDHELLW